MRWLFFGTSGSVLSWLSTLDFAYHGAPFAQGAISSSTNMGTMDICYHGAPFVIYARQS